jgi:hypothetical protein
LKDSQTNHSGFVQLCGEARLCFFCVLALVRWSAESC